MRCLRLCVRPAQDLWCRRLDDAGLDVEVEVNSQLPLPDGRTVESVRLKGPDVDGALDLIGGAPTVDRSDILERSDRRAVVRLTTAACPVVRAMEAAGVQPAYPFEVAEGDRLDVRATPAQGSTFLEVLERAGTAVEVGYMGAGPAPGRDGADLSPRQRTILEAAVEAGFYDYPRRVTLTELADELGIVKSTLSQALMVIEGKILPRLVQDGRVQLDDGPPR